MTEINDTYSDWKSTPQSSSAASEPAVSANQRAEIKSGGPANLNQGIFKNLFSSIPQALTKPFFGDASSSQPSLSINQMVISTAPAISSVSVQKTVNVAQPVVTPNPKPETSSDSSVCSLMDQYSAAWNSTTAEFDFPENFFNLKRFTNLLSKHAEQFTKRDVNYRQHFGYIEKFDLDPVPEPRMFIRADLHGDLKSLIENLRSLQKQDLLDQNFKCRPGVQLVFLGDYCDRGIYGTQILEMLMRLREENPQQVHLIRGNHEDSELNTMFADYDLHLNQILSNPVAKMALDNFYRTMSLTTYFSLNAGTQREYIQCTHGLFEPSMDPAPLLDQKESGTYVVVPKIRKLSERFHKIAHSSAKLATAAARVNEIVTQFKDPIFDITAYNWGDVSLTKTKMGLLGNRQFALNAQDIRHYLDLSSEQHRVMMLFRGHQHAFQHLMHEDKVIVTTLPVGMDCPAYQNFKQADRAYILKPHMQVSKWEKQALLRETRHATTDAITPMHPLTSSAI